jgi:NADH-quinone oxidoreductase subunit N
MYFDDPPEGATAPGHPEMRWLLSANGLVLLLFGIAPAALMNLCFEVIKAL